MDKCGPNLIAPTSTIKGIKALSPSLITLANNHILDQNIQGLISTRHILRDYKIPYVGAGDSLSETNKPYIINQNGIRIGIYTCTEHEFTIAEEDKPGSNPFDPLESLGHIYRLRTECDHIIVLYHGGKEHYRYPSPYLQKVCRKMVEKGADLVITQHSHCIDCYEEYKGATIVYGQGNFIFDRSNSEFWQTSLIIKVNIDKGIHVDYIPIIKEENGVRLAEGEKGRKILEAFHKRSKDILIKGFIEK
ncbi:CapA family protein [Garciella nitratireducens]|uniref:CapA family protein n=1 Tax=Garciella nitratireducens TaxID=218205 RepID=UPI001FA8D2E0|nr:CapA family protein [Garciella nitratireducens]